LGYGERSIVALTIVPDCQLPVPWPLINPKFASTKMLFYWGFLNRHSALAFIPPKGTPQNHSNHTHHFKWGSGASFLLSVKKEERGESGKLAPLPHFRTTATTPTTVSKVNSRENPPFLKKVYSLLWLLWGWGCQKLGSELYFRFLTLGGGVK